MEELSEHAGCKQEAYVLRCDAVELCARLEAYVETKASIDVFRDCVRLSRRGATPALGRLPTELVDMVALSVQDKAFNLRFPEWKLVIDCGEHKFRQFLYGETSPLSDMTSLRPHQKFAEAARSNVQDKFMVREKAETTAMMKHYEIDRELHAVKIDSASRFEVLQKIITHDFSCEIRLNIPTSYEAGSAWVFHYLLTQGAITAYLCLPVASLEDIFASPSKQRQLFAPVLGALRLRIKAGDVEIIEYQKTLAQRGRTMWYMT